MTTDPPHAPPTPAGTRRLRRLWPLAALAAVLAIVAAVLLVTGVFSSDDETAGGGKSPVLEGPSGANFKLSYPRTWKPLSADELAQLPGQPLAVIKRTDGHGTIVVTKRGPVTTPLPELAKGLKGRLSKQFKDFREIGAKTATLGGSRSLIYTFARTKTGTAQSLVVVPAGDHSFTLNAVVPPQSPEAAREVGAIIASFDPNGDS